MYKDMIKPNGIVLLDFVGARHTKRLQDGLNRLFQRDVKLPGEWPVVGRPEIDSYRKLLEPLDWIPHWYTSHFPKIDKEREGLPEYFESLDVMVAQHIGGFYEVISYGKLSEDYVTNKIKQRAQELRKIVKSLLYLKDKRLRLFEATTSILEDASKQLMKFMKGFIPGIFLKGEFIGKVGLTSWVPICPCIWIMVAEDIPSDAGRWVKENFELVPRFFISSWGLLSLVTAHKGKLLFEGDFSTIWGFLPTPRFKAILSKDYRYHTQSGDTPSFLNWIADEISPLLLVLYQSAYLMRGAEDMLKEMPSLRLEWSELSIKGVDKLMKEYEQLLEKREETTEHLQKMNEDIERMKGLLSKLRIANEHIVGRFGSNYLHATAEFSMRKALQYCEKINERFSVKVEHIRSLVQSLSTRANLGLQRKMYWLTLVMTALSIVIILAQIPQIYDYLIRLFQQISSVLSSQMVKMNQAIV